MKHFLSGIACAAVFFCGSAHGLDNGYRLPPLGWSTWYGFTSNINETMLKEMADGMVSSGLHEAGYEHIWIDDGWAIGRDNSSNPPGHVIVDPKLFPSGMRNLSDYMHERGLKFGVYTSKGPLTCLGYQPTQPNRPGSCGYEQVDADVYAHEWQVDQVKDDGCGQCPQHEPFAAMRDALNRTGRPIFYAIHSSIIGFGNPNATVANMWRTGGDLFQSSFDLWTNRLDLATSDVQASLTGPGAFPNPDFLEVGYSPRAPKSRVGAGVMTDLEQRSMFTMWAMLPGPLVLSADLRSGAACGGIDDPFTIQTLTNKEVIAINQDDLVQPMRPVWKSDGLEVWRKNLTGNRIAIALFHRNTSALRQSRQERQEKLAHPATYSRQRSQKKNGLVTITRNISVTWAQLGIEASQTLAVRDLWAKVDRGNYTASFTDSVQFHEARVYTLSPS